MRDIIVRIALYAVIALVPISCTPAAVKVYEQEQEIEYLKQQKETDSLKDIIYKLDLIIQNNEQHPRFH